jgi:putative ABC transport system permease protein
MAMEKDRFMMFGLPPDTRLQEFDIAAGRALQKDDLDAMVVNSAMAANDPRMQPGNAVAVQMGPARVIWRVVGVAREPFSPPVAYVPRRFFDAFPAHTGMTNALRLVLDKSDPAAIDELRGRFDANLEREGARAVNALSNADSRAGFDAHLLMIYRFLIVVAIIIGAVGGLGLMTTMSLNAMERRREIGVMRAVGASCASVCLSLVTEGALIGVMSWLLAVVIAWPLGQLAGYLAMFSKLKSPLDFQFDPLGIFLWLLIALGIGAAASFVPAWNASRMPVREALA